MNLKVKRFRINEIWIDGNRAKVMMTITARSRLLFIPVRKYTADDFEF